MAIEKMYQCSRCRQKYPSGSIRYIVNGSSFSLVCIHCQPKPKTRQINF